MEFTPIETQERFDELVQDRVDRARTSAAKATAKEYEARLKELDSTKEELTAKVAEIDALNAKIACFESEKKESEERFGSMQKELSSVKLAALKQRIAIEEGVPLEMADRLAGEDEDSVREDAQKVKGFIGVKRVAPSFNSNVSAPADPKKEGYRVMAQMIKKEG